MRLLRLLRLHTTKAHEILIENQKDRIASSAYSRNG